MLFSEGGGFISHSGQSVLQSLCGLVSMIRASHMATGKCPLSLYLLMVFPPNITHSEQLYLILSYLRTTIQDICLHRQEIVNIIAAQFTEKERSHSSKFHDQTKPEFPEKTYRCRVENQQSQPTFGTGSGNRTHATLVGGECSHHCAVPAPQDILTS